MEMPIPVIYRKRIIPDECICLKDDTILYRDKEVIITRWVTLHPKKTLHHGYSCYFPKEGIKVSKFYTEDNSLLYWYCDIVDYEYKKDSNELVVTDLLADVIIYPDGFVKVVDLDELVTALNDGLITLDQLKLSITRLDKLLNIIYEDKFDILTQNIDQAEKA